MTMIAQGMDQAELPWETDPSRPLVLIGSTGGELEIIDQGSVICVFSEVEPGHSYVVIHDHRHRKTGMNIC